MEDGNLATPSSCGQNECHTRRSTPPLATLTTGAIASRKSCTAGVPSKGQPLRSKSKAAQGRKSRADCHRKKATSVADEVDSHKTEAKHSRSAGSKALRAVATYSSKETTWSWLKSAFAVTVALRIIQKVRHIKNFRGKPSSISEGLAIVWFRNDLRVHDNIALTQALAGSKKIVPLYCFDPSEFGKDSDGLSKAGPYRTQFLLESVDNLRHSLRNLGTELVIRNGEPTLILPELAKAIGASSVYFHGKHGLLDGQVDESVRQALNKINVGCHIFWDGTLFQPQDLPFPLERMPLNFGVFKQLLMKAKIQKSIEAPAEAPKPEIRIRNDRMPTMKDLGISSVECRSGSKRAAAGGCKGGEDAALAQLKLYMEKGEHSGNQRMTPDATSVPAFSCTVSPWLSLGCLSARHMYHQMTNQNGKRRNVAASAALSELLWRDFFRFTNLKFSMESEGSRRANVRPMLLSST